MLTSQENIEGLLKAKNRPEAVNRKFNFLD